MAETKTIHGQVLQARYYPLQKSIALILRDIENNMQVKPIQIHASSFTFPDIAKMDEEMEKTAQLMEKCKFPIRIVFAPQSMDEEKAWFGDPEAIRKVYGDEWADYIKNMAKLG